MAKIEHPMQPIVWDKHGVIRFKKNAIVDFLLGNNGGERIDMNEIARRDFPREDREQFAQLIGYSVSGFGDLGYCRRTVVAKADKIADAMFRKRRGRR